MTIIEMIDMLQSCKQKSSRERQPSAMTKISSIGTREEGLNAPHHNEFIENGNYGVDKKKKKQQANIVIDTGHCLEIL